MSHSPKRTWLILSYLTNRDANACSQHIDDKLSPLLQRGIEPVLLSSTGGKKHTGFPHETALSIAPSGLRYELRSFLRLHCKTKLSFKLFETPLLIPILPFYLLEKIILDLESEWSWFIRASQKGIKLCKKYQPEMIYSTGGPACAHLAASKIAEETGIPWIAELQDPIIHDAEYHRSKRAFRYYTRLEKLIRKKSCATLFMCDAARQNCDRRTGISTNSYTIYPGASKQSIQPAFRKQEKCVFNHFGSLAGSRDGTVLIPAIQQCLDEHPSLINRIRFNFYGTCDAATAKCIANFPYPDIVKFHGKIPRSQAIQQMNNSSCLVLIQNREFFSSETIPSKLYEYMHTRRPILALTYQNHEIDKLLHDGGHFSVPADKQQAISGAITRIAMMSRSAELHTSWPESPWTAERAVDQLISIAKSCLQ
jgi:hypothetical protein